MDNFPLPSLLLNDLHKIAIICCRTVRQNPKGMPRDFVDAIIWKGK
jgi:hypothetical protein